MDKTLYITGITPDGIFLLGGIYTMKDEIGFPIEMSHMIIRDNPDIEIDWMECLADCGRQKDWKLDELFRELKLFLPDFEGVYQRFATYCMSIKNRSSDMDLVQICQEIHEDKKENSKMFTSWLNHVRQNLKKLLTTIKK